MDIVLIPWLFIGMSLLATLYGTETENEANHKIISKEREHSRRELSRRIVECEKDSHSLSNGSPAFSNPISFGTEGPNISRSNNPTRGLRVDASPLADSMERFEIANAKLAKRNEKSPRVSV